MSVGELSMNCEDLIDQIYEAAVVPERWPIVLHQMSALAGAAGGALFTASPQRMRWIATPTIDLLIEDVVNLGAQGENPRIAKLIASANSGFIRDQDGFTDRELEADPFYANVLRSRGFGWGAGTAILPPSGDTIIVNVEKRFRDGPIDPSVLPLLDRIRPHLARAAVLAARLGLERVRAATDALAAVGLAAAVVAADGRVLAANGIFGNLVPSVFQDRLAGLRLVDREANRLFVGALNALSLGAFDGVPGSIPVPARLDRPPTIVHVVPVKRSARDIFAAAEAIVIATPVVPKHVPSATVLRGLFDLTPAEARVAHGIGRADTIEAIATALGVSRETVRSHLKSALSKIGVRRQAQLASLLGSAIDPAGSG